MSALTDDQLVALAAYLAEAGEAVVGPLAATPVAGGRSNLTYRLTDGTTSWVLRRPPAGAVIESAHDVAREHRVVSALHGTPVPVARAVACDPDGVILGAPISIVAWVDGRTVRDRDDVAGWAAADFRACSEGLVAALAAVHALDPTAVGLGDLGRPSGYAARQLRRWSGQWARMGAHDPRADRLHDLLEDRVPDQVRTTVVHGDYRVDNVILDAVDPGRVRAVVDWELATLGDPVADVATMCVYRHPALDGVLGLRAAWTALDFASPEELRESYEAHTGQRLVAFEFHTALAFYKLAVIAEGIAYRHRAGVTAGRGYEGVAATVPVLLEAGLQVANRRD